MLDDWDPNVVLADPQPCRIYGSKDLSVFALVDYEDYQELSKYRWSPKWSRGGKIFYLRRTVEESWAPSFFCEHEGRRIRHRTQRTLFLHAAVMDLSGVPKPSPEHTMVDHIDRDSMNCRRENLRWATPKMNARNRRKKRT